MLTKEQYKALRRYRDVPSIPVGENGLSDVDQYLAKQGYIEPDELSAHSDTWATVFFYTAYRITELGRTILTEYEQRRRERLFQLFLVFLGSALTLLVEGLILLFS